MLAGNATAHPAVITYEGYYSCELPEDMNAVLWTSGLEHAALSILTGGLRYPDL
jgi:hypothetical protein